MLIFDKVIPIRTYHPVTPYVDRIVRHIKRVRRTIIKIEVQVYVYVGIRRKVRHLIYEYITEGITRSLSNGLIRSAIRPSTKHNSPSSLCELHSFFFIPVSSNTKTCSIRIDIYTILYGNISPYYGCAS